MLFILKRLGKREWLCRVWYSLVLYVIYNQKRVMVNLITRKVIKLFCIAVFVVNTDNCDKNTSTWVAFYFPAPSPTEVFDSQWHPLKIYQQWSFSNEPLFFRMQIQSDDSGLYTLQFVFADKLNKNHSKFDWMF